MCILDMDVTSPDLLTMKPLNRKLEKESFIRFDTLLFEGIFIFVLNVCVTSACVGSFFFFFLPETQSVPDCTKKLLN